MLTVVHGTLFLCAAAVVHTRCIITLGAKRTGEMMFIVMDYLTVSL